jgi:hypothetical protein
VGTIPLTDAIREQIKLQLTAKPAPKEVRRELIGVEGGVRKAQIKSGNPNWPLKSDALGVNPDQIAEARETLALHGVPDTEFTSDGQPIIRSQNHFRQVAKAFGIFNGAHGYCPVSEETGRPIETGRTPMQARERFAQEARKFAETGRCAPDVERRIHQISDQL